MSGDEEAFAAGNLDLWLFEETDETADEHEGDRAHRLKRLQLTVAELEGHAAKAAAEGDNIFSADLLRLARELQAKHAKWDRRSAQPPKWRFLLRRYVFNRRRSR